MQFPAVQRSIAGIFLIVAVLFSVSVRIRLADFPLERDEGEYAYAGQLLLQGVPPYKLAYNMKLPGTYAAYAGMMSIFGQTPHGIRYGMLVVNVVSILLVFVLACELFDAPSAGGAAMVYSLLSTSSSFFGGSAHATHFVGVFGIAATILMWRCLRSPSWILAFGSGLMYGTAFLMKQQGVFLISFGGVCLVASIFRDGRSVRWLRVRDVLVFVFGAVAPYLAICYWLWNAGVWTAFRFWTVDYAANYAQSGIVDHSRIALMATLRIIQQHFLITLLTGLGTSAVFIRGITPTVKGSVLEFPRQGAAWSSRIRFAVLYLVFSLLCVLPGRFAPHYYVVALPAIAILCGSGCFSEEAWSARFRAVQRWATWWNEGALASDVEPTTRAPNSAKPKGDIAQAARGPVTRDLADHISNATAEPRPSVTFGRLGFCTLLMGSSLGVSLYVQRDYFFLGSPNSLCLAIYGQNPFPECEAIARYLREHTQPAETIAVVGSEPQLYFLSQRRSSTGYIYMYPMMERQPFARRMQEEFIREVENGSPAYIVDVALKESWLRMNDVYLISNWEQRYINERYYRVGIVDLTPRGAVHRWDAELGGYLPTSERFIAIYKRR